MKELKYKKVAKDIEVYMRLNGKVEVIDGIETFRGYDQVRDYILGLYLEKKQYKGVVDFLVTFNWELGGNELLKLATQEMLKDKEFKQLKRLWLVVIDKQTKILFKMKRCLIKTKLVEPRHQKRMEELPSRIEAKKNLVIATMREFINILKRAGDKDEIDKMNTTINLITRVCLQNRKD